MSESKTSNSGEMLKSASIKEEDHVEGETLDFSGRGLKLDTENDAKIITDAINAAKQLTCLNLEGNTLGVDAAKDISKALATQSSFKKALWKDLFTGRLKDEIPRALRFLGGGLILANAHLEELDLSDNALGPVGMEGLVVFLTSPVCYSLKCLRLNNNGLGIYGGRMLAQALNDCLVASKEAGSPLSLKTFIVGRNRLENEGAKSLAEFFKAVGTLEEVQMPQNFIRHPGIAALAEALVHNPKLKILNLNDNTFTCRGSQAIAHALPKLQQLSVLNFGDCLIRSKGTEYLAKALATAHTQLTEVYMDHGEIHLSAAKLLINSMKSKKHLKVLDLNGNQFGEDGCDELKELLTGVGIKDALASLSDDEGEPDSDEEEEEDVEEEEEEEEEEQEEKVKVDTRTEEVQPNDSVKNLNSALAQLNTKEKNPCKVGLFLDAPTMDRLEGLGEKKIELMLQYINETAGSDTSSLLALYAEVVMKLCSTVNQRSKKNALERVQNYADDILQSAFQKALASHRLAEFENTLLVYMGLMKGEDKNFKPTWPLSGVFLVLAHAVSKPYLPASTFQCLKTFLTRPHPLFEQYKEESCRLKEALSKK